VLYLRLSAATDALPAEIIALKEQQKGPSYAQGKQLINQVKLSYKDLIIIIKLKS
jgi:hypothetical protein